MKLQPLNFLTILTSLLLASCSMWQDGATPLPKEPCEVSFCTENALEVRSAIADDARSVLWENGDELSVWAYDAAGSPTLSAQKFNVYGKSESRAYFSSILDQPMQEAVYTYWAASPAPIRQADGYAYFPIAAEQNGKGGGVMISDKVVGTALKPVAEHTDSTKIQFSFAQSLHLLRFYLHDRKQILEGENIERIELSFPSPVVGQLRQKVADVSASPTLEQGESDLVLSLSQPLADSYESSRTYAYATIFPTRWSQDDVISAKVYTASKVAFLEDIHLAGRNMQAGHATSVRMVPNKLRSYSRIFLNFRSNPLGENITSITLQAPAGCKWGDNGSNLYSFVDPNGIAPGSEFVLEYEDETAFRTLSGKLITVVFDSEHIQSTQQILMPDLSSLHAVSFDLDIQPLLLEDFSSVPDFSSNDAYSGGFNSGSKDATSFLNGWSGGRVGGKKGVGVRLACRRETSANYDARMDSAPLSAKIKKQVNLKVTFDYGSGGKGTEVAGIQLGGPVGQTCYVGYVTSESKFNSGATDGSFEYSFYIDKNETSVEGSYDNLAHSAFYVLHNVPANQSVVRISWRTVIDYKAGTHNNTDWLYLDNVSVTVNK